MLSLDIKIPHLKIAPLVGNLEGIPSQKKLWTLSVLGGTGQGWTGKVFFIGLGGPGHGTYCLYKPIKIICYSR